MDSLPILFGALGLAVSCALAMIWLGGNLNRRLSALETEVRRLKKGTADAGSQTPIEPPPVPSSTPVPKPARPRFNWEQFMGARLFAWVGGLALFLGVGFFLKYSFEHNLIPAELRAAIGFAVGLGLVGLGVLLKKKESAVTSQTLCGTGLLVLYAVTFACRSYYHFAFFDLFTTLALMTLVTAAAFLLAVRLDAPAVAILGIAGGFLTPVLLYTGEDNALALFTYIALLDAGLLTVAQRRRWGSLPVLGALGTVLLLAAWMYTFFAREYGGGTEEASFPMTIFVCFAVLFLAAFVWDRRPGSDSRSFLAAAYAVGMAAMASAFYFLCFERLGHGGALLFGYVAVVDLGLIALECCEAATCTVVFLFFATWTVVYLRSEGASAIFFFFLLFGLFHVALTPVGRRARGKQSFPALAVVQSFLLLALAMCKPLRFTTFPLFAIALAFLLLLLGITGIFLFDALPLVGLLSLVAMEEAWFFFHFGLTKESWPVAWMAGFYALFMAFPFLCRGRFSEKTKPWAAAALAGPLQFYFIHGILRALYTEGPLGLLPAAFTFPSLLGLYVLTKRTPEKSPALRNQIALFGGATVFFITAIFAVQFQREWITIGWALEGAALCWLFKRLRHPGLRAAGAGLLIASFVRLALNPSVLGYHARNGVPILNWYLYAYGLVALSLFAGARLLAPYPRGRFNAPAWLYALGTALAFLLLNIEIADFFAPPGAATLTFDFSGHFARDMSYSIAWAVFALLLLIAGIRNRNAAVRYASLGLLGVTLLKLFLHDLSRLDQLYRIGALVGVAVVAIFASFLYQRFLGLEEHEETSAVPPPL